MCYMCEELRLSHGTVIEMDTIEDSFVGEEFKLKPRMRAILLLNNDYYKHIPEMQCDDDNHLCVVWENNEVCNVSVLYRKKVSWRKVIQQANPKWLDDKSGTHKPPTMLGH